MAELNRRNFLTLAAGMCAACALGDPVAAAPEGAKTATIDVGAIADFKADGVTDTFVARNRLFVIRHEGRLYATSAVCTHKGAPLTARAGEIVCPKHDSRFSVHGTVTKGQAKGTLPRYAISVNPEGRVIVDTNTTFREKQFDDKAAYVEMPRVK